MKRLLVVLLLCTVVLSACSSPDVGNVDNAPVVSAPVVTASPAASPTPTPESTQTLTPAPTEEPDDENDEVNPLLSAEFLLADVMNGTNTQVIGQYGYVNTTKAELESITAEQFSDFVEKHVADSGLNWVSIICEDGTGICFAGSMTMVAAYGEVNNEGTITTTIGTIMLVEGELTYNYKYSENQ